MADFYAAFSADSRYLAHTVITQGAQSIPGNYTYLGGAQYVEKTSGGGVWTNYYGNSGAISGDISVGCGGWAPYDFAATPTRLIGSGGGNVAHTADGTKTASGSYSATDDAGGNLGSASGYWALGLTPIPRGAVDRRDASTWKSNALDRAAPAWMQQYLERYNGADWVREG